MISYQGEEGGQSIREKADDAFSHACESDSTIVFPQPKVRDNVYYIIGFLRIQAEKQAKRLAEDSGRQLCLSYFASKRFFIRNRGGEEAVRQLIDDPTIPTSLVEARERYGGLRYADARCWRFFLLLNMCLPP